MKNYIYNFLGFGMHPSSCRIHRIQKGDKTFVIFEDLGIGTSVTNASEDIAKDAVKEWGLDPESVIFLEWYPENGPVLDRITYTWERGSPKNPIWSPFTGFFEELQ